MSNIGLSFKSGLEVIQDHWKWHNSIPVDLIRVLIHLPLQL